MSKALSGLGVLAFLAPVSGSLLVQWPGWRSTMLAQALMGCAAWLLVVLRFRESIPQRNLIALHPGNLLSTWADIARNPMFQAYNLLTCATYAGLFTNLAASSFPYINVLHMDRTHYGLIPQAAGTASAINGFVMMIIAFAMGHWLGQHLDADSTAPLAFGIWFCSACTAAVAWTLVRRHGHMLQS